MPPKIVGIKLNLFNRQAHAFSWEGDGRYNGSMETTKEDQDLIRQNWELVISAEVKLKKLSEDMAQALVLMAEKNKWPDSPGRKTKD